MSKSARKRLCRVLNCRKLLDKACMHAAQNELLLLRALLKARAPRPRSREDDTDRVDEQRLRVLAAGASPGDDWSVEGLRHTASKIATLRMKLEEDDHDGAGDDDEEFVRRQQAGLVQG
uniref:NPH3 domain-containing protein n=1 Tax=Oryza rufipogon TaxID=4529 RepID=A0A0E0REZ2_ORYRU